MNIVNLITLASHFISIYCQKLTTLVENLINFKIDFSTLTCLTNLELQKTL